MERRTLRADVDDEFQCFLPNHRLDLLGDLGDDVAQLDLFEVEGHLPGFDFREIEDVVDQR